MRTVPGLLLLALVTAPSGAAWAADTPAEAEAKVRAQYGPEFMDDVAAVKAAEKDGNVQGVKSCLKSYAGAVDRDKANSGKTEAERMKAGVAQDYRACLATCGKNLPAATLAAVRPIAQRYAGLCTEKAGALDAVGHLQRFQAAMAKVPGTQGALNLMWLLAEARGALQQAKDGKGEAAFPEETKALQAVETAHKTELAKARKFVTRPDVVELEKKRTMLRAQIEDDEKLGMTKQAELAKSELRAADAKWAFLAKEAGL